jgi:hypothetical protein
VNIRINESLRLVVWLIKRECKRKLNNIVNLAPIPRSLQVFADNQEHIVFFTESSSQSKRNQ